MASSRCRTVRSEVESSAAARRTFTTSWLRLRPSWCAMALSRSASEVSRRMLSWRISPSTCSKPMRSALQGRLGLQRHHLLERDGAVVFRQQRPGSRSLRARAAPSAETQAGNGNPRFGGQGQVAAAAATGTWRRCST